MNFWNKFYYSVPPPPQLSKQKFFMTPGSDVQYNNIKFIIEGHKKHWGPKLNRSEFSFKEELLFQLWFSILVYIKDSPFKEFAAECRIV